jgi:hypothetical protein
MSSENYTEEEFQQELRDLVIKLEAEDESLRETRRHYLVQLLKRNGITLKMEIVDNVVYYNIKFYN